MKEDIELGFDTKMTIYLVLHLTMTCSARF